MRIASAGALAALVVVLAGCASTSMTTFVDPALAGRRYGKVMVHVASSDLALRKQIEARGVERLQDIGAPAASALDLFFPGREYSADELLTTLKTNGVEAVLLIRSAVSGSTAQYIPPTYHTTSQSSGVATTTGYASGSATTRGNTTYGSAYGTSTTTGVARGTSTTTVSGGHNVYKPWARFTVELIDVSTGKAVWRAQGDSSGNAFNDQEDLWQSVADNAVGELEDAGIVGGPGGAD